MLHAKRETYHLASCHVQHVKVSEGSFDQKQHPLRQARNAPSSLGGGEGTTARSIKKRACARRCIDLLVRFVSLPLDDGLLPTYPKSAQLSIKDFSIAPATASGDDEPDAMAADGMGGVWQSEMLRCADKSKRQKTMRF